MKKAPRRYTNEAVFEAVRRVVVYFWADESECYHELKDDERADHIFESVELLANWLEYQKTAHRKEQRVVTLVVMLFAVVLMFLPELISYLE